MAEQEQQWWEKFTKEDYPDTHKFLNKGHNKDAFSNLTTKAKDKHIEINAIIVQVDKKLKEADFGTYTLHSIDQKYKPENIDDPTDGAFAEEHGRTLYGVYVSLEGEIAKIKEAIEKKYGTEIKDANVSVAVGALNRLNEVVAAQKSKWGGDGDDGYIRLMDDLNRAIDKDVPQEVDANDSLAAAMTAGTGPTAERAMAAALERANVGREQEIEKIKKSILSELDPNENYLNMGFRDQ